ncbi:MAG: VWA domain-containing protein [Dehalococcoidia bacterium]
MATVALALLAAFGGIGSTRAQAPALEITQTITAGYPDVIAVVTVRDAAGAPVGGLTAPAFSAADGDTAVPVTGVQAAVNADIGLAVVLVMDTSGSMQGEPLALTQQAAISFVDKLLPKDEAIVIPFADTVGATSALTGDKAALAATLLSLKAGGSTALYDAVIAGVNAAKTAPLPRKVVILLTDGQDYGSRSTATLEQSLDEASRSGVPVFTIGVGEAMNAPYLQDLAQATGGRFLSAPAPSDVAGVYDGIGILLRSQYLVRVQMAAAADGGTSELRIAVNAAGMTASGTASFARPGIAPTPTAETEPAAEPAGAADNGGGPGLVFWVLLAALLGLLLTGGGLVGVRRLRRQRVSTTTAGPTESARSYRPPPVANWTGPAAPAARLTVIGGPGKGKSIGIGDAAVTIGTDPDCTLRLSNPDGQVAGHHARVWLREGSFMLHHLGGRLTTMVGDKPLKWAVLEDGDEIVIGPHRIRFEYGLPSAGARP